VRVGATKMRYVSQGFLESTLRRGKSLEQFMGGGTRDGERVISHLELRPTPGGIEIWRFVVPDIGSSECLDLYDFGGEKDEELICVVASAADAFSYAQSRLGALCNRWVNEGVTQDEYADFMAAGRPLRWPIVSA